MAKIAFILGELPYPLDKGAKIRTFYLLSALCNKHKVSLFGLREGKGDDWKREELKKSCAKVMVFEREMKKKGLKFYMDLLSNLFSKWPYLVLRGYSRPMAKEIRMAIKKDKVDLVICDSLQQTPNVLGIDGAQKILNTHNVESVIRRRHYDIERGVLKKIYMRTQLKKLEDYESEVLRIFDHTLVVSEKDKELMAGLSSKITVIPNGVDLKYFSPNIANRDLGTNRNSLVFTGSMDWPANYDAMLFFVKEIFPLIKAKVPDATISIVGRNPSNRLKNACWHNPSIRLTGYVDDVRPYVAESSIYVVPLRIGGGTRLKILEAMAMQKPVVSTTIGCEGLDVRDGYDIAIADSPNEFADKVISLLGNEAEARRIAQNGYNLVKEKYDWNIITKNFLSLIDDICQGYPS